MEGNEYSGCGTHRVEGAVYWENLGHRGKLKHGRISGLKTAFIWGIQSSGPLLPPPLVLGQASSSPRQLAKVTSCASRSGDGRPSARFRSAISVIRALRGQRWATGAQGAAGNNGTKGLWD